MFNASRWRGGGGQEEEGSVLITPRYLMRGTTEKIMREIF